MLSVDAVTSPRPAPPAKARRSPPRPTTLQSASLNASASSCHLPSPPPYAPPDDLRYLHRPLHDDASNVELDALLQRADNIFREREQDLSYSSDTVRALTETGAILQSRNSALMARLPTSRPGSPILPPLSPTLSDTHSRNPSRSLLWSPPPVTARVRKHSRRISSTPAELAALADQNAALLDRLRDLESDAARSDGAAKRRLRDLEREIQNLRSELDQTRAVSERLEDAFHSAPQMDPAASGPPLDLDSDLVKVWKRLDREAKVRELKAKVKPMDYSEEGALDEPKDFAPGSSLFAQKLTQTSTPVKHHPIDIPSNLDLDHASSPTQTPHERALISQLLVKISELEQANAQFADQHAEARLRLHHAELETENVRRLCDFINDELADLASLDEEQEQLAPLGAGFQPTKADRARRIRRKGSLQLDAARNQQRPELAGLRRFSSIESFASVVEPSEANATHGVSTVTARRRHQRDKPVINVFDGENTSAIPFPGSSSESLSALADSETSFTAAGEDEEEAADASFEVDDSERMKSLSSELGLGTGLSTTPSEIGLLSSAAGHIRSKSIMELLYAAEDNEEKAGPKHKSLTPTSPIVATSLDARIRHPTLRKKPSIRTDAGNSPGAELRPRLLSPLSPSASTALLFAGGSRSTRSSSQSTTATRRTQTTSTTATTSTTDGNTDALVVSDGREKEKSGGTYTSVLVEVWLWLQFAVVLVVFVVTMARMGPKSVFRSPPNNKLVGSGAR